MRVLIIQPSIYVYGGAEILITRLANYLSEQGVENALLTTSILPEMQDKLIGTEIILPEKSHKKGILTVLTHIYEALNLRKEIYRRSHEFDVINLHNFPAELAALSVPNPTVWMCNEPPELYLGSESKYAVISALLRAVNKGFLIFDKFVVNNYIDKVVVSDKFNASRFERTYGISPNIIHYGVDYEFFSQGDGEQAKDELGIHEGFILIQVGMLTSSKNQMGSVKAVEALREEIPDIKLLLVGVMKESTRTR